LQVFRLYVLNDCAVIIGLQNCLSRFCLFPRTFHKLSKHLFYLYSYYFEFRTRFDLFTKDVFQKGSVSIGYFVELPVEHGFYFNLSLAVSVKW
jgi:hypothetical protein